MPERVSTIALLRQSPFLARAGEAAMHALMRHGFVQLLPRGAILFEQHEHAEVVHVLMAGSVGLRAEGDGGARTVVEIFGAGEVFLLPAAILGLPYLASGVALTEIRLMLVPAATFSDVMAADPALARATVELLARHWRLMVDQVVDLKLRPAERRVARFLLRRVPEDGTGMAELPEPRSAIAARLGMTPETLSRALAALEERGLLRMEARRAQVLDRARLLSEAEA